jgi:hypothetical protein
MNIHTAIEIAERLPSGSRVQLPRKEFIEMKLSVKAIDYLAYVDINKPLVRIVRVSGIEFEEI